MSAYFSSKFSNYPMTPVASQQLKSASSAASNCFQSCWWHQLCYWHRQSHRLHRPHFSCSERRQTQLDTRFETWAYWCFASSSENRRGRFVETWSDPGMHRIRSCDSAIDLLRWECSWSFCLSFCICNCSFFRTPKRIRRRACGAQKRCSKFAFDCHRASFALCYRAALQVTPSKCQMTGAAAAPSVSAKSRWMGGTIWLRVWIQRTKERSESWWPTYLWCSSPRYRFYLGKSDPLSGTRWGICCCQI